MKKTLLIVFFLLIIGRMYSQWDNYGFCPVYNGCDTLFPGDREPTFYYWDTVWWDKYINRPGYENVHFDFRVLGSVNGLQPEYARYCYTDSSLRVIGIAAAMDLVCWGYWSDTLNPWDHTWPEYFNLYEVDPETDSMILLASKSWNKSQPRYLMLDHYYKNYHLGTKDSTNFKPIFEVYFDSAITLYDSFYVAYTSNNNKFDHNSNDYWDCAVTAFDGQLGYIGNDYIIPEITHFRRRLHQIPTEENPDYLGLAFCATDTNWHTYGHLYLHCDGLLGGTFRFYPCIFPIIDTSRYVAETSCERPTDLGVMSLSPGSAMLSWYDPNGSRWELSVAPEGGSVEDGVKTQWDNTVATLEGLEQGQWYFAWVRTLCDSTHSSPWSERLRFYIPADTTGPEIVITPENIVDKSTHLMPNPATDHLTVVSSFRMSTVEVWSLSGKLALRHKVDAMSTSIDVSSLPKGHYIVRIATNKGLTHKKLVVE